MSCPTPIRVRCKKDKKGKQTFTPDGFASHIVPCGKCAFCRQTRINDWSFRLKQQLKVCDSVLFVCLTYDEEHVPYIMTSQGLRKTLKPDDLDMFFDRLRKQIERGCPNRNVKRKLKGAARRAFKCSCSVCARQPVKYFSCGEYGGITHRPHYHAIIFNATDAEINRAWSLDGVPIGSVHFGEEVTDARLSYVQKYCMKETKVPMFEGDTRVKEFQRMSQGLGINYLTDQMIRWHREGQRFYAVIEGGTKIHLPRYYANKIFSDAEREENFLKSQSGSHEKFIDACTNYGYSRSLHHNHPSNLGAIDEYHRSYWESVKASFAQFYKRNKRDSFD